MRASENTRRLRRGSLLLVAGFAVLGGGLAGCGGSSQEMQLPDPARRFVERRKVDVNQPPTQPRSKSLSGKQRP
jgi:hypothetical protein